MTVHHGELDFSALSQIRGFIQNEPPVLDRRLERCHQPRTPPHCVGDEAGSEAASPPASFQDWSSLLAGGSISGGMTASSTAAKLFSRSDMPAMFAAVSRA